MAFIVGRCVLALLGCFVLSLHCCPRDLIATEDVDVVPITCFLTAELSSSLPWCILVASRLNPRGIRGGVEEPVVFLGLLPAYVHWDPRLSLLPELMKQLVRRERLLRSWSLILWE